MGLLLAGTAVQAFPLKLAKTEMRTVLRDRVDGVAHEVVYRSNGPAIDESHLRRNLNDKPDGKVHLALVDLGEGSYQLTVRSLDTGRADRFHADVNLVLPKHADCYLGYWDVVDVNVLRNDLADTPNMYLSAGSQGIRVALHKRAEGYFQFLGGELVVTFNVREQCF
ncbi:MAG: hypothetical protein J0M20_13020 [Burkholderiales bacterium]|nr:hypothetical protein [Burkholderiales bacterium]